MQGFGFKVFCEKRFKVQRQGLTDLNSRFGDWGLGLSAKDFQPHVGASQWSLFGSDLARTISTYILFTWTPPHDLRTP